LDTAKPLWEAVLSEPPPPLKTHVEKFIFPRPEFATANESKPPPAVIFELTIFIVPGDLLSNPQS
jgi:hypothetical protein